MNLVIISFDFPRRRFFFVEMFLDMLLIIVIQENHEIMTLFDLFYQVMMAFKKNFWSEKIDKADFFGRVPDAEKDRGLACLFYDVSLKVCFIHTCFRIHLNSVTHKRGHSLRRCLGMHLCLVYKLKLCSQISQFASST